MSIITLPASLRIGAGGGMGQARYDLLTQSEGSGTQQVRLLAPPRWTLRLVQPDNLLQADAATWQALVLRLRGRVNHLAAWDVARPVPLGTARGLLATSGTTAAGATSLTLASALPANNLLNYSAALDGAGWTKTSAVVTGNAAVAPDGSMTAEVIGPTVTGSTISRAVYKSPALTANATYTFSVYVKKATLASGGVALTLMDGTDSAAYNVRANFNLFAPAVPTMSASGGWLAGTATLADAGNGWYRISITGTTTTAHATLRVAIYLGSYAAYADTIGTVEAWGAQLELGTAPTAYVGSATLLAGDWLQVGTGLGTSQLVMVTADTQAADTGAMVVTFEPPLRQAYTSATAVTWDKPLAYYRQQTESAAWTMGNGGRSGVMVSGLSLDLLEAWS